MKFKDLSVSYTEIELKTQKTKKQQKKKTGSFMVFFLLVAVKTTLNKVRSPRRTRVDGFPVGQRITQASNCRRRPCTRQLPRIWRGGG